MSTDDCEQIIVAGSRTIDDGHLVQTTLDHLTNGGPQRGCYEIITGGADGVDSLARKWAKRHDCEYTEFEPTWESLPDRSGGPVRNAEMAEYAAPDGLLVAIWDGESPGTRDMIDKALDHGHDVHVRQVRG